MLDGLKALFTSIAEFVRGLFHLCGVPGNLSNAGLDLVGRGRDHLQLVVHFGDVIVQDDLSLPCCFEGSGGYAPDYDTTDMITVFVEHGLNFQIERFWPYVDNGAMWQLMAVVAVISCRQDLVDVLRMFMKYMDGFAYELIHWDRQMLLQATQGLPRCLVEKPQDELAIAKHGVAWQRVES